MSTNTIQETKHRTDFQSIKPGDLLVSYEIIRVSEVDKGNFQHPHAKVFVNGQGKGPNNEPFIYGKSALEQTFHSTQFQSVQEVSSTQITELLDDLTWEVFRVEWYKQATHTLAADRLHALSDAEFKELKTNKRKASAWMKQNALVGDYREGIVVKPNLITREEDERLNPSDPSKVSNTSTRFSSSGNKLQGKIQVIDLNKQGHRYIQITTKNVISITVGGVLYLNADFKKASKYA